MAENRKQAGWRRERETERKPKNWSIKGAWKVSISMSKIHKAKSSSTYNKERSCVSRKASDQSPNVELSGRGVIKNELITDAA